MAKTVGKLTALKIARELPKGKYPDGAGLYLHVSASGAKSWVYRYSIGGRTREMGLGPLSVLSLAGARAKRDEHRKTLKLDRQDPLILRKNQHAQEALAQAKSITFKEAAEQYMASHRASWKNAKHAAQWPSTLAGYVYPVIGNISVQALDTALVCKVLEPIWSTKPETAGRVRGRIEAVLDWAKSRGLRADENPARWRGHLEFQFPARTKVRAIEHYASYAELSDFMAKLRKEDGTVARALEFTILTAARTGEVIGARWNEIDLLDKVWTVPKERMKAKREHRVPLSRPALAILQNAVAAPLQTGADSFVFSVRKHGKPLSTTPMRRLLGRMGYGDVTVHGFRSTFRDWAAECTNYPNEVVEMALAHAVGNKVEAAYRRGDLFEKRRRLMAEWATFCNTPNANERSSVVPLRSGRR